MEGKIGKKGEKKVDPPLCHKVKQTPPMEETTIEGVDIAKPFYGSHLGIPSFMCFYTYC